jgi:thioesterase domain-containing protein
VPIQIQGTLPRFFCIAGGVGTVLYYYPLAHRLGSNQPFCGLQSKGINGDCDPYTAVPDMARHYVEAIRAVQPTGPYRLGGHCFGGIVAFEVAQQLARSGESIELLAILDIPAPTSEVKSSAYDSDDATWTFRLGQVFQQASGKEFGVCQEDLVGLDADGQAEYLKDKLEAAEMLPSGASASHVRGLVKVFRANSCAHYTPTEPLQPVTIALFRAEEYHPNFDFSPAGESSTDAPDPSLGWQRYALGPVIVNPVPGNHLTMMWEPHVQGLAASLGETLARVAVRPEVPGSL